MLGHDVSRTDFTYSKQKQPPLLESSLPEAEATAEDSTEQIRQEQALTY